MYFHAVASIQKNTSSKTDLGLVCGVSLEPKIIIHLSTFFLSAQSFAFVKPGVIGDGPSNTFVTCQESY